MPRRTVKHRWRKTITDRAIDPNSPMDAALISAIRIAPKRVRKIARPQVVEAVPRKWATEDYVLTRLKAALENAHLALDAYMRRAETHEVVLLALKSWREAARAALMQYLDTKQRKT